MWLYIHYLSCCETMKNITLKRIHLSKNNSYCEACVRYKINVILCLCLFLPHFIQIKKSWSAKIVEEKELKENNILFPPNFSSSTICSGGNSDCFMFYETEHSLRSSDRRVLAGLQFRLKSCGDLEHREKKKKSIFIPPLLNLFFTHIYKYRLIWERNVKCTNITFC